jgi:hypothetical protein
MMLTDVLRGSRWTQSLDKGTKGDTNDEDPNISNGFDDI